MSRPKPASRAAAANVAASLAALLSPARAEASRRIEAELFAREMHGLFGDGDLGLALIRDGQTGRPEPSRSDRDQMALASGGALRRRLG